MTQEHDPKDNGVSLRAGLKGAHSPQSSAVWKKKAELSNDDVEQDPASVSQRHTFSTEEECVYVWVRAYVCECAFVCICVSVSMYVCSRVCVRIWMHMCAYV